MSPRLPPPGPSQSWSAVTIAITESATQTTITPARPVKTAAIASNGTAIPMAPSVISFW